MYKTRENPTETFYSPESVFIRPSQSARPRALERKRKIAATARAGEKRSPRGKCRTSYAHTLLASHSSLNFAPSNPSRALTLLPLSLSLSLADVPTLRLPRCCCFFSRCHSQHRRRGQERGMRAGVGGGVLKSPSRGKIHLSSGHILRTFLAFSRGSARSGEFRSLSVSLSVFSPR